jgi:integrase
LLGEIRGSEAFDVLQLLNTGHAGTLSTIHASSAKQGLSAVYQLRLQSGLELPYRSIKTNIAEYINGEWRGWHAYRRGLGTRLSDMGMSATNIQSILRHANIATTLGYYVFPNAEKTKAGLKKLAEAVRKTYKVKV